jgi:hypothetical protein
MLTGPKLVAYILRIMYYSVISFSLYLTSRLKLKMSRAIVFVHLVLLTVKLHFIELRRAPLEPY